MKDYKALHHIEGLSDNAILVYEAIRNLVGMYVLQQKYKESYKKQKLGKSGSIGTVRGSNNSVVGTTMIITNPMLQEWIGDKSHNTIKSALEQLESMGFIKCSTDGVKKSGRKVTLLRDMEEYQPEEIEALEAYINALGETQDVGSEDVLPDDEKAIENESEDESEHTKTVKKSKRTKKSESDESKSDNSNRSNKSNKKDNVTDVEELDDDFEF